MTFEQSLDRLEAIVETLETGDLPLEEALALFEEGVGHLRGAGSALQQVDARVQQLVEATDGSFEVEELDL